MAKNITLPSSKSVNKFIDYLSDGQKEDSAKLIKILSKISGLEPVMWGPQIIGFGSQHYKYDSGREGDMPVLSFSPRKQNITIYFNEGFDRYAQELSSLGKHKTSKACLYINSLTDIDLSVLTAMLKKSFNLYTKQKPKIQTVEEYCQQVPAAAKPRFNELRQLVKDTLPKANEVLSYGIIGYKIDEKRPRVFISGWKDHLGVYPVPKDPQLKQQLAPYQKSKGTLWFSIDEPLPKALITQVVQSLTDLPVGFYDK
jgi:uncharacterized protein YdhG (YjbR/CyaY superfamily)